MKDKNIALFITEDGSHSLNVPSLNETYHSSHGAIQESDHVFIKNGLNRWVDNNKINELTVFEVGLGTGLNALLTALFAKDQRINIKYHSIELYPLQEDIIEQLNYSEQLGNDSEFFERLHSCKWNEWTTISDNFSLLKTEDSFIEYITPKNYDLIYFDAFAPSKQPEMWTYPIIEKCYNMLNKNGIFVTYSAKGQLKRDLKKAGFEVESLPGPPGKFEMVRATKLDAGN